MSHNITYILCVATIVICYLQHVEGINPYEYFQQRNNIANTVKRNVESKVFRAKANTRFQSDEKYDDSLTRSSSAAGTLRYDATLNYNTINIDLHPYIQDIGCTNSKLYLRIIPNNNELLQKDFSIGTLLVSSLNRFVCSTNALGDTTSSNKDEKALYRIITQSNLVQKGNVQYFELKTKSISLMQVFSNLQLLSQQPPKNPKSQRWEMKGSSGKAYMYANTDRVGGPATSSPIFLYGPPVTIGCPNCYMTLGVGFNVAINLNFWKLDYFEATVAYDLDFHSEIEVDLTHEFEYSYPILPKTPFFTVQSIWVIPICLVMTAEFQMSFVSNANVKSKILLSYNRIGETGFKHSDKYYPIDIYTGGVPKYGLDFEKLEGNVQVGLKAVIGASMYTILGFDLTLEPYIKAVGKYYECTCELLTIISVSTSPTCLVAFDTYYFVNGGIYILPISIFGVPLIGGSYKIPIIPDTKIPELSGLCIPKDIFGREMNSALQIEDLSRVATDCCGVVLNDNKTVVGAKVLVAQDNFEYYDGIILNLDYEGSCFVSYGNGSTSRSLQAATTSIYIPFSELLSYNTSEIRVTFFKEENKAVSLQYSFYRSSLSYSKETKMRSGLILLDIPENLPDYLAIKVTGGTLTQSNGVILPEFLDTKLIQFPLFLNFDGEGTVTVYPFYNLYSGKLFKTNIGRRLRFGIVYNQNDMSNLQFDSLKVAGELSTRSNVAIDGVNVQISTFSTFNIDRVHNLNNAVSLSSAPLFGTELLTLPKYVVFDVAGNTDLDLKLELLEVFYKHLTSDFKTDYSSLSTFALKFSHSSELASSGLVFSVDTNSHCFLSKSQPIFETTKQSAIWKSLSPVDDLFGFSKFSNRELLGQTLFVRYEPRDLVLMKYSYGEKKFNGFIQLNKLQNTNVTIDLKYSQEHDGKMLDTLSLNDLTDSSRKFYINVIIQDTQYTFDQISLSTISNIVKFLNTIRVQVNEETSKWNTIIIPALSFAASTTSEEFDIQLITPQLLRIKLPTYPKFESKAFVELVKFSLLETNIFSPTPAFVNSVATLHLVGNVALSGGEIGSVIASVVGFTIIGVLLAVLIIVVVYLLVVKKKAKEITTTITTSSSAPGGDDNVQEQDNADASIVVELKEVTPMEQVVTTTLDEKVDEQPTTQEESGVVDQQEEEEKETSESGVVENIGESQV